MKVAARVSTGKKLGKVVAAKDGSLRVFVKSAAKDNEANKELVKLVADHFSVAPSCVLIARGARSKEKLLEIIK